MNVCTFSAFLYLIVNRRAQDWNEGLKLFKEASWAGRRDASLLLLLNRLWFFINYLAQILRSTSCLPVLLTECLCTLGHLGLNPWSYSSPIKWDNNIFPLQQSNVGLYQPTCSQKQFITAPRCEASCWHKATAIKGCSRSNERGVRCREWTAVGSVWQAGRRVDRSRSRWGNLWGPFQTCARFQGKNSDLGLQKGRE